jgi:hypothetical protein
VGVYVRVRVVFVMWALLYDAVAYMARLKVDLCRQQLSLRVGQNLSFRYRTVVLSSED